MTVACVPPTLSAHVGVYAVKNRCSGWTVVSELALIASLSGLGCSGTENGNTDASGGLAGSSQTGGLAGIGGQGGSAAGGGSSLPNPSTPERIADPRLVSNLGVKDAFLYWGDSDSDPGQTGGFGHLVKLPLAGGPPVTLASATAEGIHPMGIAVDDTSIYWSSGSSLFKSPLNGSGARINLWSESGCSVFGAVALEALNVYWFSRCNYDGARLMSTLINGGPATVVGSGTGSAWSPGRPGENLDFRSLALGGGRAFWTNVQGSVVSMPLAGGVPSLYASNFGVASPTNIAIVGDRVYYTVNDYMLQARGSVEAGALDGTNQITIASAQNIEVDTALAVDGEHVYWAVNDAILMAPVMGGAAVTVASGRKEPRALAVDALNVYWAEDSVGIFRVSKRPK